MIKEYIARNETQSISLQQRWLLPLLVTDISANISHSGFETPPSVTVVPKRLGAVCLPRSLKDRFHLYLLASIAYRQTEFLHRWIKLVGLGQWHAKGSGSSLLLMQRVRECMINREFKSNIIKLTSITLLYLLPQGSNSKQCQWYNTPSGWGRPCPLPRPPLR